jgi:hypothetical protein
MIDGIIVKQISDVMTAYNLTLSKQNLMNILKDYSVQTNIVSLLCWVNNPTLVTITLAILNFLITFYLSLPKLILTWIKTYDLLKKWHKGEPISYDTTESKADKADKADEF